MFKDREQAGQLLAKELAKYKGDSNTIILSLPRGGVVLGYELAKELGLPHNIVVTRKVGYPSNPEVAACATNSAGMLLCERNAKEHLPDSWIQQEALRQVQEAKRREDLYRAGEPEPDIFSKTVILVDDGIATGLTVSLAIKAIQAQKPAKIILATPVIPQGVYNTLSHEVDEIITLTPPDEFGGAVGAHYEQFGQVGDDEVLRLLHRHKSVNT